LILPPNWQRLEKIIDTGSVEGCFPPPIASIISGDSRVI